MSGSNVVIKKRRKPRVTYSDLPIQVADRSLSRMEFVSEITKGTGDAVCGIFGSLNNALSKVFDLKEDFYSFNEIVNRGSVSLDFYAIRQLKAQLTGLSSMQQLNATVIVDRSVSFELRVEENQVCLDVIKGAFARVSDRGRSYRAELTNIVIQDTVDGGILILADCIYFLDKNGNSKVLNLMFLANQESGASGGSVPSNKKDSMKKFRQSYADLDAIGKSSSSPRRFIISLGSFKKWFKNSVVDKIKN